MENMNLVLVAGAAFGGGILSAFLGWLDSKEPFVGRKFGRSCIFALLSALGFAVTYSFADGVTARDICLAIIGGSGVDGLSNYVIGASTKA